MNLFIICVFLFIWITIIIVSNSIKEPEPKIESEKEPVKKDTEEPEVYLEPISDEFLSEILPGIFENNGKFVSISSVGLNSSLNEISKVKSLRKCLKPTNHYRNSFWDIDNDFINRKMNSPHVFLYIKYFDKDLNITEKMLHLERRPVGYSVDFTHSNQTLADLKKFLGTNPKTISQENVKYFLDIIKELTRKESDKEVKEFVEYVFQKHTVYNSQSEIYNTEKAVPITSVDTFFNFCNLSNCHVPSNLKAEITNYLYILYDK